MIDLHNHILPAIDDGPTTVEEAVALVRLMQEQGIATAIVTPHFMSGAYEPSKEHVLEEMGRLQALAPGVRLLPGAELYLEQSSIARLQAGGVFTLADRGRHILVELPMGQLPNYVSRALLELENAGLTPILAHPERNEGLLHSQRAVEEIRRKGVLFQVDANSIVGDNGLRVQRYCRQLCQQGLIDFVATDCHSPTRRPPQIQKALAVARTWGWDLTPQVTHNPAVVLGEEKTMVAPLPVKGPSFIGRLAGRLR